MRATIEERLESAIAAGATTSQDLLGKGILAMTVDQGEFMQRYQGIVQLDGSSLEEVARAYFRQSEQIPTEVRLATAQMKVRADDGTVRSSWRAGGLIVQFLPESTERMRLPDISGGDGDQVYSLHTEDDSWAEVKALTSTIQAAELVDPAVGVERLLYRLFHERGVNAYPATRVFDECSCSREKIHSVLSGFSAEEITSSIEDGLISVACEFCSTTHIFKPNRIFAES